MTTRIELGHLRASERGSAASSGTESDLMVLVDDRHHEWHDEHIKLIRACRASLWRRILNLCIFVHDYDPYAIFKGHQQADLAPDPREHIETSLGDKPNHQNDMNASIFGSRGLRMKHTSRDEFRHKSTRWLRIFALYYFAKAVAISLTQHTLMRYEHLVPKNQSRPLVSLETTKLVADFLGNPYSALEDISLMLYAFPAGFYILCAVLFPIYYKRHPMNIANLRFILDPRHELKRMDASIRCQLAAIRASLRVYKSQQAHNYQRARLLASGAAAPASLVTIREAREQLDRLIRSLDGTHKFSIQGTRVDLVWLDELEAREEDYCEKIEEFLDEFAGAHDELKSFRPTTFAPDYFVAQVDRVERAVLGSQAGYTLCWLVLASSLVYSAYSKNCPPLDCNPARAFSWPEILVMIESLTILALTNLGSTLNSTLLSALTQSQLDLIGSIKTELRACREVVARFIEAERDDSGAPLVLARQRIVVTLDRQASGEDQFQRSNARDKVERQLLKSLIRLMVCDRELKDNSRCISEQTLHPFYYVAGALLLAATGAQFKMSDSNFLRWFIVFVVWFSFNQVAVSCANVYARILKVERQLWSILAANSQLFANGNHHYSHKIIPNDLRPRNLGGKFAQLLSELEPSSRGGPRGARKTVNGKSCTFVADLWLKFVHSTSANVEQHCSRLFNTELSYQTIIEANFFSIFIYSLTLSPDK